MERVKMPRSDRAKQFAPFDALKGLQNALRIKEYEHERIVKGELPEEKICEISRTLMSVEKRDVVKVVYFDNGHEKNLEGEIKIVFEEQKFEICGRKIDLNDLLDIKIVKKS